MKVTRTFDILANLQENYSHKDDILAGKRNGEWVKYSVAQYVENSHLLSYGFLSMGFQPEDKVIIITENRPEWNFLDMSLQLAKMIPIPVYTILSVDDYAYIIKHSDAKMVVIGNENLYNRVNAGYRKNRREADGLYGKSDWRCQKHFGNQGVGWAKQGETGSNNRKIQTGDLAWRCCHDYLHIGDNRHAQGSDAYA